MLEDLKKRLNLAHNLGKSIENNNYQSIVSIGDLCAKNSTKLVGKAGQYEVLFDKSDLAFVGANHGNIIGPLFALEFEASSHCAILKEYLTISKKAANTVDQKLIEEELTALAIVISVFYPGISKIKLPIGIGEFNNQECEIKKSLDECFLNILRH